MTSHDTWKLGLNDPHFEDDSYDKPEFTYDRKAKKWRDERGRFVSKKLVRERAFA